MFPRLGQVAVAAAVVAALTGCAGSGSEEVEALASQVKADRQAAEAAAEAAARDRAAAEALATAPSAAASPAASARLSKPSPAAPKPVATKMITAAAGSPKPAVAIAAAPRTAPTQPKPTPVKTQAPLALPASKPPVRQALANVVITLDTYHMHIDTFPRNCATPRVWIDNKSDSEVRSIDVVFKVNILDIPASREHLGPDTGTGERDAGIPPQSKYSMPLKICIDPSLLPPTPEGRAYPDALTVVKSVASFKAYA